MSDTSILLQRCLDRLQAGDAAARNELLNHACDRLRRLTRKMLRDSPAVRRWEETDDVFQNAMLRLCRALQDVTPDTLARFYQLAALQVRRELIDLARHHYGPRGSAAHHASQPHPDPPAATWDPSVLGQWTEFHEQAGRLPEDERAVFDLLWYQGLTQDEAARVLGVSLRTVKSRWRAARLRLFDLLGGELPGV